MYYDWIFFGAAGLCWLIQLFYCKTRHLGGKGLLFSLLAGSGVLALLGLFHVGLAFNAVNLAVSLGLGVPGLIILLLYSFFV